jgi:uncharacterized membrane protein YqhA
MQKLEKQQGVVEKYFEGILWGSRFLVIFAVISSLGMAMGLFYVTAVEVYFTLSHLTNYHLLADVERMNLKATTLAHVIGSVDGFLLGIIMLIFAFGLYELFISKIDQAEKGENSNKILTINNLDDLKDKLAKVILIILIVMFFEQAVFLEPKNLLELLYYAGAIALVALALYFSYKAHSGH